MYMHYTVQLYLHCTIRTGAQSVRRQQRKRTSEEILYLWDVTNISNKLSPAGIGSKKLSSQVQLTLRLVLLRKVSSEKLSSQIQFCLRLVLLRKTKNPAMFQNQGKWSLRHPFSKLSLQIYFEDTWGSWLGLGIFILNQILSFVPCSKFGISILILKVQRQSMSLKS